MPSVELSDSWFCRVDVSKDEAIAKSLVMLGWVDCEQLLCLSHLGETKENPHIHFCIKLNTKLQKQSWDVRFKKLFKPEKKSSWSTKSWDGSDSACSYMFHEPDADIIARKGFSDDDIARFTKLNMEVQKVVAVNKERGPKRVVERIVNEIGKEEWTRFDILQRLCRLIKDGEMYEPGDYKIKTLVEEIFLKSTPELNFDNYVSERYDALFRRS